MNAKKKAWVEVCVGAAILAATFGAAPPSNAQNCTSAPDAAVDCFVGDAVRAKLLTVQYGMSMTQFKAYGVSVSKIVQSPQASLAAVALASAVADAMPATNASGSANAAAQTAAIDSIVAAAVKDGFIVLPAETSQQDVEWFVQDLVSAMNSPTGIVMSPGTMLRVIDSYVVSSTSSGTVNWTEANSAIATMMTNLSSSGLLKLPASVTAANATAFAQSLAQIISTYKTATGRTSL
jgi:pyruvate-formate lyase